MAEYRGTIECSFCNKKTHRIEYCVDYARSQGRPELVLLKFHFDKDAEVKIQMDRGVLTELPGIASVFQNGVTLSKMGARTYGLHGAIPINIEYIQRGYETE